jgi:hypothetical protein
MMAAAPKKAEKDKAGDPTKFRIPAPILADLNAEAKEEDRKIPDLIRQILRDHTRAWRKKKGLLPR